jgi:hypothetical protein
MTCLTNIAPESILQLASAFMPAKHLFVANEIGLFATHALANLPLRALSRFSRRPLLGYSARGSRRKSLRVDGPLDSKKKILWFQILHRLHFLAAFQLA